jgi:acetylornithine deacetylase/succinyl-diaminopimelate desuccinylase-like protein
MKTLRVVACAMLLGSGAAASAASAGPAADAKEILKRSIGFRTVEGQGQMPAYAAYLASVLKGAGFGDRDVEVVPHGDTAMLVARYRGTSRAKPIVLIGHMDVVVAKPEDWERDPFTAVEENGFIFGRGAEDNKFDVSMMVATLARLKSQGFRPRRDIVLALTGDEETTGATARILAERLKGAELVLNGDAGGGQLGPDGRPHFYALQAAEKTYADFEIEITDAGGHSSTPTSSNAIYRLGRVLARIDQFRFPTQANELTRASLQAASRRIGGELGAAMARFAADPRDGAAAEVIAARPEYVGQIRTTCVATMVNGGHARNALPQRATANVNCRIFPGVTIESVKAQLERVAADPTAKIALIGSPTFSDASPLRADVMKAVTRAVHARDPKLTIIPAMSAGATDGLFYRAVGVPTYGVSGLFARAEDSFAHGLNERVPVAAIAPALRHWESLIRDLSR